MKRTIRSIALGLACGCASLPVVSQVATKTLSAGSCLTVSNGDVLDLEWNPAFDSSGGVTGVRDFELLFAHVEEMQTLGHIDPSLLLRASVLHTANPAERDAVTAESNGFYRFRFRPNLSAVRPGTYKLVRARAAAFTPPDFQGNPPAMTNNPAQSSFCLEVVAGTTHAR